MQEAVIAAVAVLAGVIVGRLLEARGESTKWLREHRSIAYAAFAGSVERYLTGVLIAKGSDGFRTSTQGKEMDRIFGDLEIFGTERAYLAASEVRRHLLRLHELATSVNSKIADPGFETSAQPIVRDVHDALREMRTVMKSELRVT